MPLFRHIFITAIAVVLSWSVQADSHESAPQIDSSKPAISSSRSVVMTATVKAIDKVSREVTLEQQDGQTVTFTASEQARNLQQVEVGDTVTAEYQQHISVQVLSAEGAEPTAAALAAIARSEKGAMPGVAAIETQVEVSMVEAINLEANTFKLKAADGSVAEYSAANPENLKRAAVGDAVIMTYTQALAISVEKMAAE